MMALWKALLLIGVGLLTGIVNVMAGGGSLLTMPILVFLGMDGPVANGTNRVAILAQNITATFAFFKKGFSDFKLSLTLTLCALPGAIVGAYIGTRLGGIWFNRVLAAIMVAVMILMAKRDKKSEEIVVPDEEISKRRRITAHILMVFAGFYGGFIQAGVGFILMAILHKVLRLDLVRVNMHKVFIVGVYTIVALVVFASKGQVVWLAGVLLAVGNATGGWIGTRLAIGKGEKLIRIMLNVVLIIMAVKLLFFS
jgi:uncharacterized membrane protein YfcA